MRSTQPHRVPALTLGWMFLRIGATAYGGLGTTLALIERELVTKRGMLTPADVTEALTYTKLLPGSTGPQAIAYLGYKLGGWPGSALAMGAFLFPSALLMVLLAAGNVKNVALTACMHTFLTILNAMLTHRTPWQPQEVQS